MTLRSRPLIGILAIGLALILGGCGSDPQFSPQQVGDAAEKAKQSRAIFDSVGGDWNRLTPEDHKKLVDLSEGSEKTAKALWEYMSRRKTGVPTPPEKS